jgi:plastocyanin
VRKLVLLTLVAAAGAAAAIVPSLGSAQGATASFTADDGYSPTFGAPSWFVTGTRNTTLTVTPGTTVSFGYPTGSPSTHNVDFTGAKPTSCTQTSAPYNYAIAAAPPLPHIPEPPGWSGTCRFETPGTYTFECDFHHAQMSATITVAAPGTTTTTTTSATTTTTTTTGSTTTTFHEPPIPAASRSLRAAAVQHGTVVRGQIHVTTPSSRLVADLFSGATRYGRMTIHGVRNGTRHFAVGLNITGRRALARRHQLRLLLQVQVLGQGVGPTTLARHVTLIG